MLNGFIPRVLLESINANEEFDTLHENFLSDAFKKIFTKDKSGAVVSKIPRMTTTDADKKYVDMRKEVMNFIASSKYSKIIHCEIKSKTKIQDSADKNNNCLIYIGSVDLRDMPGYNAENEQPSMDIYNAEIYNPIHKIVTSHGFHMAGSYDADWDRDIGYMFCECVIQDGVINESASTTDDSDKKDDKPNNKNSKDDDDDKKESKSDKKDKDDDLDDEVDRNDKKEEEEPILEDAISLCQSADDTWLLMENTIIKIQSKAIEYSVMLESAGTEEQKTVAKNGAYNIASKAIGTVITTLVERVKQMLNSFMQGLANVTKKVNEYFTNVETWATKADKALTSVNETALKSYEFVNHEWKNAFDFSNASKLIEVIDKTLPSNPSNPHDALRKAQDMNIDEFKAKLLAQVGIKSTETVLADMHSFLRGNETKGTGSKAELSKLINAAKMAKLTIDSTNKKFKDEVTSKLQSELSAIGKIPKTSTSEDDHVLAQYMSKRISFLQQAISFTNLMINTEISSRREMCTEYMRIVNNGIRHANSKIVG
jgi:hypothetical protein